MALEQNKNEKSAAHPPHSRPKPTSKSGNRTPNPPISTDKGDSALKLRDGEG
jgi:hypothetical protein